jgi:hypothetical protein
VTSQTIYAFLANFKTIELKEGNAEVRLGGGVSNGELFRALAAKRWMTVATNSNAVGKVLNLLGGLSHALAGREGIGVDCIKSLTMIPFTMPDGRKPRKILL